MEVQEVEDNSGGPDTPIEMAQDAFMEGLVEKYALTEGTLSQENARADSYTFVGIEKNVYENRWFTTKDQGEKQKLQDKIAGLRQIQNDAIKGNWGTLQAYLETALDTADQAESYSEEERRLAEKWKLTFKNLALSINNKSLEDTIEYEKSAHN